MDLTQKSVKIIYTSVPVTSNAMILKMKRSAQLDFLRNIQHPIVAGRRAYSTIMTQEKILP